MRYLRKGILLLGVFLLLASTAGAEELTVQVRNGQLRQSPSFLGKIVAEVSYGDTVRVMAERGGWVQVRGGGKLGWIHTSALTDEELELAAGDKDAASAASSDELALAGKGFNSDVEAEFKARNEDIDFTWVDRIEKIIITPEQMRAFLDYGEVTPPAGGVK